MNDKKLQVLAEVLALSCRNGVCPYDVDDWPCPFPHTLCDEISPQHWLDYAEKAKDTKDVY